MRKVGQTKAECWNNPINKLKEAYQPKDSVTEVELYERLLSVKMKAKDDPRTLFEQVASI